MHAPQIYDRIGIGYHATRRPDPRIAAAILDALGSAQTVVNIGAGAGSYEPADRRVIAVEPSATMIRQWPFGSAPAVQASAMDLPFADSSFQAAMAVLTIHHWPERDRGLAEMRRVSGRSVILTWEPAPTPFWLTTDYFPEILEHDRKIFSPWFREPALRSTVRTIPIPHDCVDGFLCAYWRRPQAYLDPMVRRGISSFARIADIEMGLSQLRKDLADGTWHCRNAGLLDQKEVDFGYRLIVLE